MKKTIIAIMFTIIGLPVTTLAVDVNAAYTLAKENDCFRCHGIVRDKDGSAFKKLAAKYKTDPHNEQKLFFHLTSGELAKFPDGHYEPHHILKADENDIKNLVDWILSF
jgi:cytochrome c